MIKKVVGKTISSIITIILASMIVFGVVRFIPGDPVKIIIGSVGELSSKDSDLYNQKVNSLREEYKLDEPVVIQYVAWAKRAVSLDFGKSMKTRRDVKDELAERLPATVMLSVAGIIIEFVLGLIIGMLSAAYYDKLLDKILRLICVVLISIPGFVVGLMSIYYFGVINKVYSISVGSTAGKLWLPAMVLGLVGAPKIARYIRANILEELGKGYIVAEIARGYPKWKIVKNAFANSIPIIITYLLYSFTTLIGGAVVIENVFSWPGLGAYALESVLNHDYPAIQAYVCITVLMIVVINYINELIEIFESCRR
ncbi:MAG: ABC transporter permease [Pseudobutyrivibrio sp.]|nr:ABC transporter permease [Pseudobutyrivibrio sp.]